jgi:hypothetical protein
MSINVEFSDPTRPNSNGRLTNDIVIPDGNSDDTTSLTFLGKKYAASYSKDVAENFLHLLENFASGVAPRNPERGQIWFNTNTLQEVDPTPAPVDSEDTYGLKVFDGITWLPIGIIKKAAVSPTTLNLPSTNLKKGDLYVDTSKNQLYIWNGTGYSLVGPLFNAFEKTGIEVEEIINNADNQPVAVVSFFLKARRVAILTDKTFSPKLIYEGFKELKQGFNLSSSSFDTNTKYWGISEKAVSLIVGGDVIGANNFLRSDVISTTNYQFNVKSDNGIILGSDSSYILAKDPTGVYIYNKNANSSIDFRIKKDNSADYRTVVRVSGDNNGRVGINNTNPQATLDINGDLKSSGDIEGNNIFAGASVEIRENLSIIGNINWNVADNEFDSDEGNIINVGDIIPRVSDIGSGVVATQTLGSSDNPWKRIFVNEIGDPSNYPQIYGNFTANNFTIGNGTGTINGYSLGFGEAITITTATNSDINLTNAAAPNSPISIQTAPATINIKTEISSSFYKGKDPVTYIKNNDLFLIQSSDNDVYYKATKRAIIDSIPVVPVGTVILFGAGLSNLPNGYLPCDGREVPRSLYSDLFSKIGYKYCPQGSLPSFSTGILTFALPDLKKHVPNFYSEEFVPGLSYTITELGTTNWVAIGYTGTPSVNGVFTAIATGSGTGRARLTDGLHYIIYTGKL